MGEKKRYEYALGLGSNIGTRVINLRRARILLMIKAGNIHSMSSIYRTSPWGEQDQESFFNQVVLLQSSYTPRDLYQIISDIEAKLGKQKSTRWGPRIIDIDILLAGSLAISEIDLTIPHPRMLSRNFVLIPLAEIAGDAVHPLELRTINELVQACEDDGTVEIVSVSS